MKKKSVWWETAGGTGDLNPSLVLSFNIVLYLPEKQPLTCLTPWMCSAKLRGEHMLDSWKLWKLLRRWKESQRWK